MLVNKTLYWILHCPWLDYLMWNPKSTLRTSYPNIAKPSFALSTNYRKVGKGSQEWTHIGHQIKVRIFVSKLFEKLSQVEERTGDFRHP